MKTAWLAAAVLVTLTGPVCAQDCSVGLSGRSTVSGSSVCITNTSYPNDQIVVAAADRWNNACESGSHTPTLDVGGCANATHRVSVVYQAGFSTNETRSCGDWFGTSTSSTIRLYEYGVNSNGAYPCAPSANDTLTHELGHALGLANADASSCAGHIMGRRSNNTDRLIYSDDCLEVDRLWRTSEETVGGGGNIDPLMDDKPPGDAGAYDPAGESPILVDLSGDGFDLTVLAGGVRFDLDPDGVAERVSWTASWADDAFLVLDRNGNGIVDDGTELFGNFTPQPMSDSPNGFAALAVFDERSQGGNADGAIGPEDAVYAELRLWRDADHDAVSDAAELVSLPAAGIVSFDLGYRESRRRDRHGNVFRYRAKVIGSNTSVWAWDVFLLAE